ncbi:MAG: hypothetical protein IPP40_05350 [bacterium]|nr:hypothetical protein [bacterium]
MKGIDGATSLRYGKSLFQAALKVGCAAEVEQDLQALAAIYQENRELPCSWPVRHSAMPNAVRFL